VAVLIVRWDLVIESLSGLCLLLINHFDTRLGSLGSGVRLGRRSGVVRRTEDKEGYSERVSFGDACSEA
jgi:hypothetical protein